MIIIAFAYLDTLVDYNIGVIDAVTSKSIYSATVVLTSKTNNKNYTSSTNNSIAIAKFTVPKDEYTVVASHPQNLYNPSLPAIATLSGTIQITPRVILNISITDQNQTPVRGLFATVHAFGKVYMNFSIDYAMIVYLDTWKTQASVTISDEVFERYVDVVIQDIFIPDGIHSVSIKANVSNMVNISVKVNDYDKNQPLQNAIVEAIVNGRSENWITTDQPHTLQAKRSKDDEIKIFMSHPDKQSLNSTRLIPQNTTSFVYQMYKPITVTINVKKGPEGANVSLIHDDKYFLAPIRNGAATFQSVPTHPFMLYDRISIKLIGHSGYLLQDQLIRQIDCVFNVDYVNQNQMEITISNLILPSTIQLFQLITQNITQILNESKIIITSSDIFPLTESSNILIKIETNGVIKETSISYSEKVSIDMQNLPNPAYHIQIHNQFMVNASVSKVLVDNPFLDFTGSIEINKQIIRGNSINGILLLKTLPTQEKQTFAKVASKFYDDANHVLNLNAGIISENVMVAPYHMFKVFFQDFDGKMVKDLEVKLTVHDEVFIGQRDLPPKTTDIDGSITVFVPFEMQHVQVFNVNATNKYYVNVSEPINLQNETSSQYVLTLEKLTVVRWQYLDQDTTELLKLYNVQFKLTTNGKTTIENTKTDLNGVAEFKFGSELALAEILVTGSNDKHAPRRDVIWTSQMTNGSVRLHQLVKISVKFEELNNVEAKESLNVIVYHKERILNEVVTTANLKLDQLDVMLGDMIRVTVASQRFVNATCVIRVQNIEQKSVCKLQPRREMLLLVNVFPCVQSTVTVVRGSDQKLIPFNLSCCCHTHVEMEYTSWLLVPDQNYTLTISSAGYKNDSTVVKIVSPKTTWYFTLVKIETYLLQIVVGVGAGLLSIIIVVVTVLLCRKRKNKTEKEEEEELFNDD